MNKSFSDKIISVVGNINSLSRFTFNSIAGDNIAYPVLALDILELFDANNSLSDLESKFYICSPRFHSESTFLRQKNTIKWFGIFFRTLELKDHLLSTGKFDSVDDMSVIFPFSFPKDMCVLEHYSESPLLRFLRNTGNRNIGNTRDRFTDVFSSIKNQNNESAIHKEGRVIEVSGSSVKTIDTILSGEIIRRT